MISWGHHLFKLANTFDILVKKLAALFAARRYKNEELLEKITAN